MSTTELVPDNVLIFARSWWVMLLRGIFAILFGFLVLAWPRLALATLILCFGMYALIDGVFSLFWAIRNWRHQEKCWFLALEGLAGICASVVALQAPALTAFLLLLLIAGWILATGLLRIVAAIRSRSEIAGEAWLMLSGLAAALFGFLVLVSPAAGAVTLLWLLAVYAFVLGAFLMRMSIKMRRRRVIVYRNLTRYN